MGIIGRVPILPITVIGIFSAVCLSLTLNSPVEFYSSIHANKKYNEKIKNTISYNEIFLLHILYINFIIPIILSMYLILLQNFLVLNWIPDTAIVSYMKFTFCTLLLYSRQVSEDVIISYVFIDKK